MDKRTLLVIWSILFLLCAILGFIPAPTGFLKGLMVVAALGFFVPPALLVWKGDASSAKLVRNLSIASLAATLAAIVLNLLSVVMSEAAGQALYAILVIVSTPMVCGSYWILSLFCWAFLMTWAGKKCKIRNA